MKDVSKMGRRKEPGRVIHQGFTVIAQRSRAFSWVGFSSMASMQGGSRKVLMKAENSLAAPVPTSKQLMLRRWI
jgi:hypothetical protein